ncbi:MULTISPECIES: GLPGLI family protein [Chryseobacterium]|uniref:GLPGLI family protein n=1 Tax=Chryseobacterium TaxID=59732 RepID=UPI001957A3A1|nr:MULTISPECIES: GLPGLI family protein [Chryseobacterium]MBM7418949.1 GLPGLI family protein [Chryseobacterium sp. JUb44]MDH6208867.1 GLPGLI family protein [Chryseobacterium sp. BIGb0186]WSO11730.1 GLPGLI family protein [Chryseobacterium scophthalmum]
MKIKSCFFSLFLFGIFSAQSYKAVYDFKWKPQKNATEYLHEDFALLINENKSSDFLSYIKFKNDSTKTKTVKDFKKVGQGSMSFNYKYGESKFNDVISKNYINKEILFQKQLYDKLFLVKNECKINWKINSEKDKFLGYSIQKATTEFGGKKWIAWFTTEIPVQDGPYKFSGLPGLILKITDSENEFIYEMKSITKETNDISERNYGVTNTIKLSSEKYQKIWEDYKKQPSSIFNYQTQTNNDGWTANYTIGGGNPNDKKYQEKFDKQQLEFLKNFENPIELKNDCQ